MEFFLFQRIVFHHLMEFELSNQFYLGPSESHAKALRNEVDPKGPSSTENSPQVSSISNFPQKFIHPSSSSSSSRQITTTGIMRLLPLMKQLELILHQKSLQSLLTHKESSIQEEEDDQDPHLSNQSFANINSLKSLLLPASTPSAPQTSALLDELSIPDPPTAPLFSNVAALVLEASVASYKSLKLRVSDENHPISSPTSSQNTLRLHNDDELNPKVVTDSPLKQQAPELPTVAPQDGLNTTTNPTITAIKETDLTSKSPVIENSMSTEANVNEETAEEASKKSIYPASDSVSSSQSTATDLPDPTVRSVLPERSLKMARTLSFKTSVETNRNSDLESLKNEPLVPKTHPKPSKSALNSSDKPLVVLPKSNEKQYEPYVPKSMIPDHIPRIQPPLARNQDSSTGSAVSTGQKLPDGSSQGKEQRIVTPKTQSASQFATPRTPSLTHNHKRRPLSVYSTGSTPKQTPRSTKSHKRSSTLGDISTIEQQHPENPNKKGFSFKLLFKKSKNHSLNDINDVVKGNETKERRKSISIPSFESPGAKKAQENPGKPTKKPTNKRDSAFLGVFKKSRSLEKKPVDLETNTMDDTLEVPSVSVKDSSTVDSYASYNTQESVRTHVRVPSTPSTDTPQTQRQTNESSATTYNSSVSYHKPAPVKAQANHIREVNDSDYDNSFLHHNELDYDSLNGFMSSQSAHLIHNGRVDNEILLDPADKSHLETPKIRDSMLLPDLAFGLPFRMELQSLGSTKDRGSGYNVLAGETLFPKLLSAQEVESIVSLERLRSMRSHKLKRNSFINYSGSNENIVHGEDRHEPNSARRSSSILKNSESSRSLQIDEVMDNRSVEESGILESLAASNLRDKGTIEQVLLASDKKASSGVQGSTNDSEHDGFSFDGDFDDFIEFTDFIEPAQLNFSPVESVTSFEAVAEPPKLSVIELGEALSPVAITGALSPEIEEPSLAFTQKVDLPVEAKPLQSLISRSSEVSAADQSVPKGDTFSPKLRISHPSSSLKSPSPLTYSSDRDFALQISSELTKTPLPDKKVTPEATSLPIFEPAFRENKPTVTNGKSSSNNRPISMSFKGLDSRSFQGKLAMHDMRNLSSHQSFNISFDDSEASGNIGNGFGSSDDELEDDLFDEQSDFNSPSESTRREPVAAAQKFNLMPPQFNRLPQNSNLSPRSLSSFISRNFKKPVSPRMKAGVKFSSRIVLYDTYSGDEYDRHPEIATCNQLTPILAQQIREELNNMKATMEVHRLLIGNTHFI